MKKLWNMLQDLFCFLGQFLFLTAISMADIAYPPSEPPSGNVSDETAISYAIAAGAVLLTVGLAVFLLKRFFPAHKGQEVAPVPSQN